ncbi:hypothetical protein T484DRAFT_1806665 [Baffinella frigidus]|nr:hypothetical protein T484DRAFT_1806665 [Cryptophyta sp. CCMP2293]
MTTDRAARLSAKHESGTDADHHSGAGREHHGAASPDHARPAAPPPPAPPAHASAPAPAPRAAHAAEAGAKEGETLKGKAQGKEFDGHHNADHSHLNLHQRNKIMEGAAGDYKFLTPQQRWAHEELDKIDAARHAAASVVAGMHKLASSMATARSSDDLAALHGFQPPPSAEPSSAAARGGTGKIRARARPRGRVTNRRGGGGGQTDGWKGAGGEWDLNGPVKPTGGILSTFPDDDVARDGFLTGVTGDSNVGGALAKVDGENVGGSLAKVSGTPNGPGGNWLAGLGSN